MGGRGGAPRTNLSTVIAQAAARAEAPVAPAAPQSLEQRLLSAIDSGERHYFDKNWGTLAGVFDQFPDVPRDTIIDELKRLDRARIIQLSPETDQKNQTRRERDARFKFGGDWQSLVRVNR